jgi:DNA primase
MGRGTPRGGGIFEILRAEIDYSSVVERFTTLSREGGTGILVAFCPLQKQNSSNPAFKVYPDGHAHCYSCKFHGDVANFWQEVRVRSAVSRPRTSERNW